MTRREKARFIMDALARLFPEVSIPLRHRDPYTLLVSVVLSAQSTDARVNTVTPALFARASMPAQMAALRVEEIEAIIRSCGLAPRKARALQELSHLLLERHGGQVPRSLVELEALPGVGHKTAQVVMAQAFGEDTFPVDTHIHRLAWRWGLSTGKSVEQTEKDLKRLFPKDRWSKLHLQIIYFGRQYCPARGHDPAACPLCATVGRKGRSGPLRSG